MSQKTVGCLCFILFSLINIVEIQGQSFVPPVAGPIRYIQLALLLVVVLLLMRMIRQHGTLVPGLDSTAKLQAHDVKEVVATLE
jgi:hypothetical protein